jgi:hypothetical protein
MKNRDSTGAHAGSFNVRESLDGRRATNAQIGNAEPDLGDNCFFLEQPDRLKNRPGMSTTGCGRSAVSHHADGAGSRFGLVEMVVSRLCHRRPQHQGQAYPRQQSNQEPHAFLHWANSFQLIPVLSPKAMPGELI